MRSTCTHFVFHPFGFRVRAFPWCRRKQPEGFPSTLSYWGKGTGGRVKKSWDRD